MPPAITVTPAAKAKIEAVRAKSGHPDACLRIAIAGRRGGQFVYELDLVAPEDAPATDIRIETPDLGLFVLDRQINPSVAAHGGFVDLLEVRGGSAYVQLGGGCQGCAQVDVTLRQGIEVAIKAAVPQIMEVIDVTDHAAGTNPYFQPAKKAS
jgi:Fe-S cluster biogenesis protein NfuA